MGTKVQTHGPIGVAFVIRNTSGSHQETAHFPSTHSVLKRRVCCVSRPPLSVVAAGMHAGWKGRATVGRFSFVKRGERQVMKESWRDLPPTHASLSQCASLLSDPGGPSHSSQKSSGEAMGLSSGTGRLLKQLVLVLPSPSCWLSTSLLKKSFLG